MVSQVVPFRLYSHEIAFHTPYLARFAEEAADGFAEAGERFARVRRFAELDSNPCDPRRSP